MLKKTLLGSIIGLFLSTTSLVADNISDIELYEMKRFNSAMQIISSCTELAIDRKSIVEMRRCRTKLLKIITDKKTGKVHTVKCGSAGKCGFGGKDARQKRTTKCGGN
jgi:hypothetical protein